MIKFGIIFCLLVSIFSNSPHPEAKLYFTDYCRFYNYPVEIHDVTTDDGYILRVFRIQKKATSIKAGLKPILLQHGLLDSSDTWLINDEDKAPAFMLANLNYDVWLGNSRGNKHSRKHVKYNPDKDKQFWEFTFQHMADQDLPAVFKHINNVTNKKISYIGHSQGTIQMHVALSKRNEVIQKLIDKYIGFGPVAYVGHITSPLMQLLDKSGLLQFYNIRHVYEFMPSMDWFETEIGVQFCATFGKVCADTMKYVMDANPSLDNYNRYDVLVGHDPSGTSVMNMAHWKQLLDKSKFQAYDYGSATKNMNHYGQAYPPLWQVNQIRVSMHLVAGSSDQLADLQDVNYLWSLLDSSVKKSLKVYDAGHCTFMWGITVQPWMNDTFQILQQ